MASKIKADQFETLDGSGNITLNNSVTMASTKTLPAASLTGTVPTASLGSGTASSSVFLRGDGSWQAAGSTSASDLTSGTLPMARLSGTLPALNGSALTNLPGGTPSAGAVVQVVTESDTGGSNDGGTFAWQDTHVSATITPQYSNSKIVIHSVCQIYMNNTSGECSVGLDYKRAISGGSTTNNLSGDTATSTAQHRSIGNGELTGNMPLMMIDTPGTTSAITYTLRVAGTGSANCIWGWQGKPDTMTITEVKV
jgi:hypothetical protein